MEHVSQNDPKVVLVEPSPSENSVDSNAEAEAKPKAKNFSKKQLTKRGIIHPGMQDMEVMNSFRNLRTSLLPKMGGDNSIILLSSILAGGGASFNAINLAVAFTFDLHRNALLIDCHFGKPSLAKKLGVEAEFGLYDYVTGRIDNIQKLVYPTAIPRLRLVPCGNIEGGGHIEYFTGEKMQEFLHEVKNRYANRVIILDTPPILDSADTSILAELCDHVVLVMPYQKVSPSKIERTIKVIDRDKVAGFILNN